MKTLAMVVLALLANLQPAAGARTDPGACKPVTATFCQGLGYSTTMHPTGATGFNLQQIGQMVETACSPHIATVMCRVAVPECGLDTDTRLKPCRALCEKVKTDCEAALRSKRLYWPSRLRCDTLPQSNCIQGAGSPVVGTTTAPPPACQTITVPICKDQPYSQTMLPNSLGHRTQDDASLELHTFAPLLHAGCSDHLKPFLCSVYTPECVHGQARLPCRTVCEQARSGCEPLLNKFGFQWPPGLRCEAFSTDSCGPRHNSQVPGTCQPITVPLCTGLPYNETFLPNPLGQMQQEDIGLEIHQYYPLVKVGCSPYLKDFLCSVYTPKCVSGRPLPPCRSLCEQARSDCEPMMNRFGFQWPNRLRCESFSTESCKEYGVGSSGQLCEPITIPICQGLSYNQTMIPNLLGHTSQREAATKMSFFNAFVQTVCQVDIRLFVCMVYVPKCEAGEVQRPCRSFCERSRQGCEGLMRNFGISWPEELQCDSFPEGQGCISGESRSEALTAEDLLVKLNAGGFSVRGKSLSLKTARLLLTLMDEDNSGELETVEVFKLEHYAAALRREYVESYESRNPPSVSRAQMRKSLTERDFQLDEETFRTLWVHHQSGGGIDYDEFVAVLTKLQILKDRFQAHLLRLPCDCQVASFSFKQFLKAALL